MRGNYFSRRTIRTSNLCNKCKNNINEMKEKQLVWYDHVGKTERCDYQRRRSDGIPLTDRRATDPIIRECVYY